MVRPRSVRQYINTCTLLACLLGATGCHSWHTYEGDFPTVITPAPRSSPGSGHGDVPGLTSVQPATTSPPDTVRLVRVTMPTRGTFELWNPRIAHDTLFGQVVKGGAETGFPFADVTSVQTKSTSAAKTILLITGIVALTYGAALGITAAGLCAGATDC